MFDHNYAPNGSATALPETLFSDSHESDVAAEEEKFYCPFCGCEYKIVQDTYSGDYGACPVTRHDARCYLGELEGYSNRPVLFFDEYDFAGEEGGARGYLESLLRRRV